MQGDKGEALAQHCKRKLERESLRVSLEGSRLRDERKWIKEDEKHPNALNH